MKRILLASVLLLTVAGCYSSNIEPAQPVENIKAKRQEVVDQTGYVVGYLITFKTGDRTLTYFKSGHSMQEIKD